MVSYLDGAFGTKEAKKNRRMEEEKRLLLPSSTTLDHYLPPRLASLTARDLDQLFTGTILGEEVRP